MKFHDNTIRPEYGADGALLDNWNPDGPFPENSYINVHFRIDANGFDYNGHFNNAIEQAAFNQEVKAILNRFGIMEDCGYSAERAGKMKEWLYIHPQDISGVVRKQAVKAIADALESCKTCSLRWVDVYEEVFDMTEEAFIQRLEEQKQAIKADLMRLYETKRSNLYIVPSYFSGPEKTLEKKYHIFRHRCQGYQDGPCYSFICQVREEMVGEGLLVTAQTKGGTGYRTVKQAKKAKKTA